MTEELEKALRKGRITTTRDLDDHVLSAARAALRPRASARPRGRLRRLLPAVAAALALVVVGTGFAVRGERAGPSAGESILLTFNRRPLPENGQGHVLNHAVAGEVESLDLGLNYSGDSPNETTTVPVRLGDRFHVMTATRTIEMPHAAAGLRVLLTENESINRVNAGYLRFEALGDSSGSTEAYDSLVENRFLDPRHDPLSTFGIDVDSASYTNVRRFLTDGQLPPPGAVRVEEMVNFFDYAYAGPDDGRPFAVSTEVAECPWAPAHRLVRIGIQARRIEEEAVPPRNLVFLIDVSGSMQSSDKLPLVTSGLALLAERLREEDNVAIVVYAGASGVVLEPTSGYRKGEVLDALGRLEAGGSTNGGEGIRLAYDLAKKHFDPNGINRVILATDGDFNVGTTDRSSLVKLIEEERKSGVFLTVLGVGTGNLKDSQMEELADKGNGSYHYLDGLSEARRVLVEQAGGTLVTVAKDVKIQVEFNPAAVGAYRLVGYENRMLAAQDFADDKKDAGEIGAGHSVTALYEVVPAGERADVGDVEPLRYQLPRYPAGSAHPGEVLTVKLRYKMPDGDTSTRMEVPVADPGNVNWTSASEDYRFAAAVASFGLLLRGSEFAGNSTYDSVAALARTAIGDDPAGRRAELLDLIEKAKALSTKSGD